ncbi:hypothetical protein B0I35DRAFT_409250 [Stachybotrys elegans]|uniref:Uncharacterized protein n=1 Tax=Stachybotrys elegans TaxID=80388 RepID=A0A8K0SNV4_9HYPO|nr:hypothetical protein B0I35DRAFT_409250 [Stachybotrys elegans]
MLWKHNSLPQLPSASKQDGQKRRNDSRATDPGVRHKSRQSQKQLDTRVHFEMPEEKQSLIASREAKEEHASLLWTRIQGYVRRASKQQQQQPARKLKKPALLIQIPEPPVAPAKPRRAPRTPRMALYPAFQDSGPATQDTGRPLDSEQGLRAARRTPDATTPSWSSDVRMERMPMRELPPRPQSRTYQGSRRRPSHLNLQPKPSTTSFGACAVCKVSTPDKNGFCRICDNGLASPPNTCPSPTKLDIWRPLPPLPPTAPSSPTRPSEADSLEIIMQRCLTPPPPLLPAVAPSPRTPLSQLPTPTIELRFRVGACELEDPEQDLYDGEWAEYYFDKRNFVGRGDVSGSADLYMHRELDLEEYEAAFDNRGEQAKGRRWL